MRLTWQFLLLGALLGACSLDWDIPETKGSETTAEDPLVCCFVCPADRRPAFCGEKRLDGSYSMNSDCATLRGYAYEGMHSTDSCFEFSSCDCANCGELPQTLGECNTVIASECGGCLIVGDGA
jgi:hypothetical protein